ncbi:MAG TPA: TonB-dependent receptor plug domain-containing protein, partial [Longimicrobiales bacterium]|nr:TonB-dependent receptor plug domain-containing protein [Longimicrobiales bacterium]
MPIPEVPIRLAPIVVEVVGPRELELLASGSPQRHIDRVEIEQDIGRGLRLADVLHRRIPGLTVDPGHRTLTGGYPCVEYRRPASFFSGCQPPLVIVDGIRIAEPNQFFDTMPLEHVESLTVLSAAAAGVRYGMGSLNGVIRVTTRRPGTGPARDRIASREEGGPEAAVPEPRSASWKSAYDWSLEPTGHPWVRALGGATAGTLGGLALALGASGACSPLDAARAERCSGTDATLASAAAFTLPVLGAALGANLSGRTDGSRGRIVMTTLAALTPMFMGYFFATPRSDRIEFEGQKVFGRLVVLAGVPVMASV